MLVLNINWTNAFIVTGLGISLVITLLILLVIVLMIFSSFFKKTMNSIEQVLEERVIEEDNSLTENEKAAIAMALYHYYNEVHDDSDHVLTLKYMEKKYHPWNSKIYGLNNLVR